MDNGRLQLEVFGLKEQPFAPTADPTYFYATPEHKSCLFRLWNSIDERHGIAVVLGNYGTGKTTLLRKLMTGMANEPERYNIAVVGSPIPSWTTFALLEAIVTQFDLTPRERSFGAYMDSLNHYLLANRNRINTLIIDDAQNLNKRGQLELLRLAQNLETPQHKLLNLVLFAQLEWREVLQAAPNFQQRINLTYTLAPLTRDEVGELIRFRLTHAGASMLKGPHFDESAVETIHRYSEGNPRLIVNVCRNALVFSAQTRNRTIGRDIVLHTIDKTTLRKTETLPPAPEEIEAPVQEERIQPFVAKEASQMATAAGRRGAHVSDRRANQLLLRAAQGRQG